MSAGTSNTGHTLTPPPPTLSPSDFPGFRASCYPGPRLVSETLSQHWNLYQWVVAHYFFPIQEPKICVALSGNFQNFGKCVKVSFHLPWASLLCLSPQCSSKTMHPTREAGVQAVRGLLLLHRCVSHQKKSLTLITTHHIGNVLGPQTIDLKLVLIKIVCFNFNKRI